MDLEIETFPVLSRFFGRGDDVNFVFALVEGEFGAFGDGASGVGESFF